MQEFFPRNVGMSGAVLLRFMQELELTGVHAFMIARIIAKPQIEPNCPDDSYPAEQLERVPPRHQRKYPYHQQRRERAAPPRAQPHHPDRAAPLLRRQPVREHLREIRKTARFSRAEKKARCQ